MLASEAILRIHFVQQWFGLSDPAMEEASHDILLHQEFAGLDLTSAEWHVVMRSSGRQVLNRSQASHQLIAQLLSWLEAKHGQLVTSFVLTNLWTVRKQILQGASG